MADRQVLIGQLDAQTSQTAALPLVIAHGIACCFAFEQRF
jgi:hypothetical protein